MAKRKIAVVGVGKIAVDQHLPVIDKSKHFEVAATVSSRMIQHRNLPVFKTQAELFAAMPEVKIVANCTPPSVRHDYVREALEAGKHVLMEKPPTPTVSELDDLVAYARKKKLVLFQTWHSRYNDAVDATRKLLKRHGVKSLYVDWRESVRKWHPGQEWVWEPGGYGVFDPGTNALAILTEILPFRLFVKSAVLRYPANRQTPIGGQVTFKGGPGNPSMTADLDWLEARDIWTIRIETLDGRKIELERHGVVLKVDGELIVEEPQQEYERIYERFAKLLRDGKSDVDGAPLHLTADIFFLGRRDVTDRFDW